MIGRRRWLRWLSCLLLTALLAGVGGAAAQVARERIGVRITDVDASAFPAVRARVLATGPGSVVPADLSRLVLRENGVPIANTTQSRVSVGMDVVLVIDANNDYLLADELDGPTRRDKVAQSVAQLAEEMNLDGLDRVSIVVPDPARQQPVFLAEDVTEPAGVMATISAYDPAPPADVPLRPTPLQAMMDAAIEHLAADSDGRFQAVLLYSDAARLETQLDATALTQAAQAASVPLFVAILGAEASPEETANATRLTEPTNGQTIHMPSPETADTLYDLFAAQSQQTELAYRSDVRQNGMQQVAVSLGNVQDTATYDLTLAAPEVTVDVGETTIRREGSATDTPLALLQPAVVPLAAQVAWPGEQTRGLTEVVFLVDGVAQPQATTPTLDAGGRLPLVWDVSGRDVGVYQLSVSVTDELGFQATAEPVAVTIEVARPAAPTPTAAPTVAPEATTPDDAGATSPLTLLLPLGLLTLAGVLFWAMRRAGRKPAPPSPPPVPPPPPPAEGHRPVLDWLADDLVVATLALPAANVTLGRDAEAVDVVIDDPSVSRLHARIRRRDDAYWLYDEGSAQGTYLNHERLGLAPQPLRHGDTILLGRVALRFRLVIYGPQIAPLEENESTD